MREGSQILSAFILINISANIAKIFPREAALVLGTALVWAYYDDETSQLFPQPYVDKIKAKTAQLQGMLESNENPVKKVQIIVSGEGVVLVNTDFKEINMEEGETSIQNSRSCRRIETAAILQQMQVLMQQKFTLETEIHSLKVSVTEIHIRD